MHINGWQREGVHVFKKQLILSKLYGDKIFGDLLLFQTVALNRWWLELCFCKGNLIWQIFLWTMQGYEGVSAHGRAEVQLPIER